MKKHILLFALLLTQASGVTTYDCSTANNAKVRINQIYNPQTGNETGYVEIYVDNGPVNLEGWKICYGDGSHNRCVDIGSGNGDVYVEGALLGNDTDASNIPDNAFVVFDEALFATSGNPENTFAQAKGEAVLLDPAGDAAHYLVYHNSNFNTADWDAGAECTTDYTQTSANNNGICATPDFSQPDSQWSYNCDNTMGTYNADPATPIADWRMDECLWDGSTGEVRDSKSSHHGTSKALNNDGRVATTFISGILNRSGEFKGEGYNADPYNAWYTARYYLEIPDHDALSPLSVTQSAQMSITGWFRLNSTGDTHTITHKGGNNQEYRVFVEAGKLKFTVWDIWGSPKTVTVNVSLSTNRFYFFAVTAKGSLLAGSPLELTASLKDGTSTYTQSGTFAGYTYTLFKTAKLFFGATDWGWGGITNFLNGFIDEIKLYNKTLSSSEIDRLYAYESAGRNYNGTSRVPSTCEIAVEEPSVFFDAWDTFRSLGDRNISTKIVNKPFSLTVASLNNTNDGFQDFNGTVCVQLLDSLSNLQLLRQCKGWNSQQSDSTLSFTVSKALADAKIRIAWKKDASSGTFIDGSEDNSTFASDHFAIRPESFALSTENAVAGVDFNITFTAPIHGGTSGSPDYNEASGGSFDVTVNEHNFECPLGTFTPSLEVFSFVDGSKTFTTRYDEVGILDVNITDLSKPCESTFARIDCDDLNVSDGSAFTADVIRIGQAQGQIRVIPHHFDLNATLSNFGSGTFTYLSDDTNMSAVLELRATAKNAEDNTTRNYSQDCYAKSTTLTLEHSAVPSPLTQILYRELLSVQDGNLTKTDDISLDFNASVFTHGEAPFDLRLNFDRDPSKPLNPFDFNLTSASLIDSEGVIGTTAPAGNATFVFGRIRPYDITTNQLSVPVPVEIEIYGKNSSHVFTDAKPATSVNWYRNTDHDGNLSGSVFSGDAYDPVIEIDTGDSPENGIHLIKIDYSAADSVKKTIHLDIPEWLWYSPVGKTYNTPGTNCTEHPCFSYEYTPLASDVPDDQFRGSDFEMTPAKDVSKKGAKIFR